MMGVGTWNSDLSSKTWKWKIKVTFYPDYETMSGSTPRDPPTTRSHSRELECGEIGKHFFPCHSHQTVRGEESYFLDSSGWDLSESRGNPGIGNWNHVYAQSRDSDSNLEAPFWRICTQRKSLTFSKKIFFFYFYSAKITHKISECTYCVRKM
jgi:hypothetical protein